MLKGGTMKDLYEMRGQGAFDPRDHTGVGRLPELGAQVSEAAGSAAGEAATAAGVQAGRLHRLHRPPVGEGLGNCVVLHRELRERGYDGGYSILKAYVSPRRRRQPRATMRFETEPGEQAQVDWGSFSYVGADGRKHRLRAFVMVLGWSRAIYVEFVRRADVASFMQCHVNAFEYFGGALRRCLYDNAKVVVLGLGDCPTPWRPTSASTP